MDDINQLFQELKQGKIGLFFGAGMSFNSGLPTIHAITQKILKSIELEKYLNRVLKLAYPFELFMEEFSAYIDLSKFLDIFKEGKPNHFYHFVCDLVEMGIVDSLMTTNFDLLIEKTKIIDKLNIIDNEHKFKQTNNLNYIKIHGDISNKTTIRTTMSQIFRKRYRNSREIILNHFFKDADLRYIIVMGYSCSDVIDISPAIKTISKSRTRIVFIEHANINSIKFKRLSSHELFSDFTGTWLVCDTDSFLKKFYFTVFNHKLKTLTSNFDVDVYFDFAHINKGIPDLILSNIFFKNSQYKIAQSILENALTVKSIDESIRADIYVQLLEVYHNLYLHKILDANELSSKIRYFNEAIVIYRKKSKFYGLGQSYNHWGHILGDLEKFTEALKTYTTAERYFKKVNDKYRIAQIKINKAHINLLRYNKKESNEYFENAKINLKSSYEYFSKSGKIFDYSILLYNLGCLWILKPNKKRIALKYFQSSLSIANEIKDVQGIRLCKMEIKKIIMT